MSYFILYFEQSSVKDKSLHEMLNFYTIDHEITEGRISVQYNEIDIKASVIASRLDASLFYVFKKPTKLVQIAQQVRFKLFEFIKRRMDLKIDPYLFVFNLHGNWPNKIKISEKFVKISIFEFESFFRAGVQFGLFKIIK
jgi:hypothetical protein